MTRKDAQKLSDTYLKASHHWRERAVSSTDAWETLANQALELSVIFDQIAQEGVK